MLVMQELVLHSKASCVDFQREVAILMRLRHQNIVRGLGYGLGVVRVRVRVESGSRGR